MASASASLKGFTQEKCLLLNLSPAIKLKDSIKVVRLISKRKGKGNRRKKALTFLNRTDKPGKKQQKKQELDRGEKKVEASHSSH